MRDQICGCDGYDDGCWICEPERHPKPSPSTPSAAGGWDEHTRIWLEPPSEDYGGEGRVWCQDNVWPLDFYPHQSTGVEFVRLDLHTAAVEAARREERERAAAIVRCLSETLDKMLDTTVGDVARLCMAVIRARALTPPSPGEAT